MRKRDGGAILLRMNTNDETPAMSSEQLRDVHAAAAAAVPWVTPAEITAARRPRHESEWCDEDATGLRALRQRLAHDTFPPSLRRRLAEVIR